MRKSKNPYPTNWSEITKQVKDEAGWRCVRCKHLHDPPSGHTLTVHHLDLDPANNKWWNIPPLCQRCHLTIQSKVVMEQYWMFEHSAWFKPYVAGYYASLYFMTDAKEFVMANIDDILNYARIKAKEK